MTNLSTTSIWEALKDGKPISSILQDVPDEFYDKVRAYENYLLMKYSGIESDAKWTFLATKNHIKNNRPISIKDSRYRAEFAYFAKKYKYPNLLFAMLDNRVYSQMIWKILKPKRYEHYSIYTPNFQQPRKRSNCG